MSEICGKKGFLYLVLGLIPILILLSITNSRISQHSPAVQQLQSVENNAVRFNLPAESEAKCLDGSQPAYYLHRGSGSGKHKWLVFFEGGGWCYDLQQCYLRSKTTLGSSNEYPPHMTSEELRFYFSGSQVANPAMHDWNIVYVRYCDGSSYAGDATNTYKGHTLHFKGKHNRDETIRSLFHLGSDHSSKVVMDRGGTEVEVVQRTYNMSSAEEVVIAGCSAGGLGVLLGLDQMADIVRTTAAAHGNTRVTVRGLVDSGFFLDHTSDFESRVTHQSYGKDEAVTAKTVAMNGQKSVMDFSSCMRENFDFMNISAGANPACLRAQSSGGRPVRNFTATANCVFAEYLVPHIKTPMFLLQPRFDQWQILHIYSQQYTTEGVNAYGRTLVSILQSKLYHAQNPGHGAFVDSCTHHCTGCSDSSENPWSGDMIRSTIAVPGSASLQSPSLQVSLPVSLQAPHAAAGTNTSVGGGTDTIGARLPVPVSVGAGDASAGSSTGSDWNEAEAFSLWYARSLQMSKAVPLKTITPGVNWFFQERAYPCEDCCKCSVDMVGQLRKKKINKK